MSSHPNVMLMCYLTVDGTARKTLRDLAATAGSEIHSDGSCAIKIGGRDYTPTVLESGYDDDYQISGDEGQIVLHDYLTYGYGETCKPDDLIAAIDALEAWAKLACARHGCAYEIKIGANYW